MRHPLDGVTVVDLAAYIAGAYCSALLADLGAKVVKVESPVGDGFRSMGASFQGWNRGKRAMVLDLKKAEARRILYRMVEGADVVTENYRPGVAQRLGVDYESLRRVNPRIVYCSVYGYGSDGPYGGRPAFDPLLQAQSGAMADQGGSGPPMFLRVAISDYAAAILAAYGVVAALVERERTGRGQRVETSLLNCNLAAQAAQFLMIRGGDGSLRPAVQQGRVDHRGEHALYRLYRAADGWLFLSCPPEGWGDLCEALDRRDLLHRFPDPGRDRAGPEMNEELEGAFLGRPVREWVRRLRAAGVLCAPVKSGRDLHSDPQAHALGLTVEADSPDAGPIRQMGPPLRFSETPPKVWGPAPALGQHTDEVLTELGFSAQEVARLREQGVVA